MRLLRPASAFTLFYFAQFLFLGVQLPFFPGWLYEAGFSERAIGFVTGGSLVLRLALGPVVAWWAESRADQRTILMILTGVMSVSAALMLVGEVKWSIAVLTILAMWSFGCLTPLTDTAVMRADKAGILTYGKTRAAGSLAFIVANLVGGVLVARTGEAASVVWMAASAGLAFLVATSLPARIDAEGAGASEGKSRLAPPDPRQAAKLFRSRSFLLMLAATGLTQGAHAVYYAFSKLHWSNLGYESDLIGVLWTLGVIAEIGVLFLGRNLIRRFGPAWLIAAGALAAAIRWPLIGLSPPLGIVVVLQLLHALTFATTYIGSVEFIARAVPGNLSNTGMTLVSTLGIGAMTGAATIIAGLIFTPDNPFPAYLMMGGMGLAGFIAALALMRHWNGGLIKAAQGEPAGAPSMAEELPPSERL